MMTNMKPKRRNSLRLKGYDYTQSGAYFVTIVTHQRECLFGEIVDDEMLLNDAGKIVKWEWERLPKQFGFIELGTYQIMPNHIHAIIVLRNTVGATRLDLSSTSPQNNNLVTNENLPDNQKGSPLHPKGPLPKSLGTIIGQFKSRVTKRIHKNDEFSPEKIWQRGFHDRIIRNEDEWSRIYLYIESNPINWHKDHDNPINL